MVTEHNNNKFYTMESTENNTFIATWGRVGSTITTKEYPMSRWNSIYNQKVKKGYVDRTDLFIIESEKKNVIIHENAQVQAFVNKLQSMAKQSIIDNYTVSSSAVTEKQIEKAQGILDTIQYESELDNPNIGTINQLLLELYSVLPRKMGNVKNYLVTLIEDINNRLVTEQANVDVMAGQVKIDSVVTPEDSTLLEALGIQILTTTDSEKETIKKMMKEESGKFTNAYQVINNKTQKQFNAHVEKATNKNTNLFWHGSRNENWWSITNSGLVLRPSNAVITGKMFGYGIYFADKCRKAIGYSSLRGSYWAGGIAKHGMLALFDVHTGNQLKIEKHQQWCYNLNESSLRARGEYDSLFAKGGIDLINNEYIVYNPNQLTIKYLVEIR